MRGIMEENAPDSRSTFDSCRNCDGEIVKKIGASGSSDPEIIHCLLCDRYYRQGRIFLGNVG
jgi:hypothetical protein